jgi:hypothetical protein
MVCFPLLEARHFLLNIILHTGVLVGFVKRKACKDPQALQFIDGVVVRNATHKKSVRVSIITYILLSNLLTHCHNSLMTQELLPW